MERARANSGSDEAKGEFEVNMESGEDEREQDKRQYRKFTAKKPRGADDVIAAANVASFVQGMSVLRMKRKRDAD